MRNLKLIAAAALALAVPSLSLSLPAADAADEPNGGDVGALPPPAEEPGADGPAQERDRIAADRPGATDTSQTVGRLRFQIELGGEVNTVKEDGVRVDEYRTPFELRFGVTQDIEIGLAGGGYIYDIVNTTGDPDAESTSDFGDLFPRLRWHFLDKGGPAGDSPLIPSTAVFLDCEIPTGSNRVREAGVFFSSKLGFDWDLPLDFGLSINAGLAFVRDRDGDRQLVEPISANLSRPLTPVSEDIVLYFSSAAVIPGTGGGRVEALIDAGMAYFLTDLVQIDCFWRAGLTPAGPDFGTGFGIAVKLP